MVMLDRMAGGIQRDRTYSCFISPGFA